MHPLIQLRQHSREARHRAAAAAIPTRPDRLRGQRLASGHELVTDDDGTQHIAPRVLCDRRLDGWHLIPRTRLVGVIR